MPYNLRLPTREELGNLGCDIGHKLNAVMRFQWPAFHMAAAPVMLIDAVWSMTEESSFRQHTEAGESVEVGEGSDAHEIMKGGGIKNDVPLWLLIGIYTTLLTTFSAYHYLASDSIKSKVSLKGPEFYTHFLLSTALFATFILRIPEEYGVSMAFLTALALPAFSLYEISKLTYYKHFAKEAMEEDLNQTGKVAKGVYAFMHHTSAVIGTGLGLGAVFELVKNIYVGGYLGERFEEESVQEQAEKGVGISQAIIIGVLFFAALKNKEILSPIKRIGGSSHAMYLTLSFLEKLLLLHDPKLGAGEFTSAKGQIAIWSFTGLAAWMAVLVWQTREEHGYFHSKISGAEYTAILNKLAGFELANTVADLDHTILDGLPLTSLREPLLPAANDNEESRELIMATHAGLTIYGPGRQPSALAAVYVPSKDTEGDALDATSVTIV